MFDRYSFFLGIKITRNGCESIEIKIKYFRGWVKIHFEKKIWKLNLFFGDRKSFFGSKCSQFKHPHTWIDEKFISPVQSLLWIITPPIILIITIENGKRRRKELQKTFHLPWNFQFRHFQILFVLFFLKVSNFLVIILSKFFFSFFYAFNLSIKSISQKKQVKTFKEVIFFSLKICSNCFWSSQKTKLQSCNVFVLVDILISYSRGSGG